MDLTPEHREALLLRLAQATGERQKVIMRMQAKKEKQETKLKEFDEVDDFLEGQRIESITQAIIDNTMDY